MSSPSPGRRQRVAAIRVLVTGTFQQTGLYRIRVPPFDGLDCFANCVAAMGFRSIQNISQREMPQPW